MTRAGQGPLRRHAKGNRRTVKKEESCKHVIPGLLRWFVSLFLVVASMFAIRDGWHRIAESNWFTVKDVEMTGLVRVDKNEVLQYADLLVGDSILDVDLDEMALSLRRHPWIQQVTVRRLLPDRVLIELVEYEPALLVSMGAVYIANAQGEVFKRFIAGDQLSLPVLTGLSRDDLQDEAERSESLIQQAYEVAEAFESDQDVLGRLDEIHWDPDLAWSVVMRFSSAYHPLRIYLGKQPLRRLPDARRVVRGLREWGQVPSVIWVDGEKNPDRVHVRLRDQDDMYDSTTVIAKARY